MTFQPERYSDLSAAVCAHAGADLSVAVREDLFEIQRDIGAARKALDVLAAEVAGVIFAQTMADPGPGNIARSSGFRGAKQMIAESLGTSQSAAQQLIDVGVALARADAVVAAPVAPPDAIGEEGGAGAATDEVGGPQPRLLVAEAVRAGTLAVDKAQLVVSTLNALGAGPNVELALLRMAHRLKYYDLKRACERELTIRDSEGLAARDRRLFDQRSLTLFDDATGMTIVQGRLDPASAGHLRAWLDAQVTAMLRAKRLTPGDDRTPAQMRVDALAALAHHGVGCDDPGSGVKTVLVLRTTVDELEKGVGVVTCDSMQTPISVETLRVMAVDAGVLPLVMGGPSVPLDVGRLHRLATWYQRMAVLERDGGCAWCHAPASFGEIHHIKEWGRWGTTDLDNLVALCVSCHHRVHYGGWLIEVEGGSVYFTPPAQIDPSRTRRRGGLADLDLMAELGLDSEADLAAVFA